MYQNIRVPGLLHGVFAQVVEPVDEVEEGEGQGEEDAWPLVDGACASQLRDWRKSWALLEENGHGRTISWLTATHRVVSPLQAFLTAVRLSGGGRGRFGGKAASEEKLVGLVWVICSVRGKGVGRVTFIFKLGISSQQVHGDFTMLESCI